MSQYNNNDLLKSYAYHLKREREKRGTLGTRLTRLIKEGNLPLRQLSELLDIPVSTLHNWSSDKSTPTDFHAVERLADWFEVSMEYLLIGEDK